MPLIFDRFRTGQVHETDPRVHDTDPRPGDDGQARGTGLGLPLVRAVARAHGGNVTVHSELGKGSEFELTLPAPSGGHQALPVGSAGFGTGFCAEPGIPVLAGTVGAGGATDTVDAGTLSAGTASAGTAGAGGDSDPPAQLRDHG